MDDMVNRFARELADAIAAAVSNNAEVEACRERARAAGLRNEGEPRSRRRLRQPRPSRRGAGRAARVGATAKATRAPQALRDDCQRSPLPAVAAHRGGGSESRGSQLGPPGFANGGRRDGGRGLLCRLRIAQIAASHRFERRPARRRSGMPVGMFNSTICCVRDVVEVLHQRAQRIAVRGNQHPLSLRDRRRDRVVPIREEAGHRVFQRFGERQFRRRQAGIARDRVTGAARRRA